MLDAWYLHLQSNVNKSLSFIHYIRVELLFVENYARKKKFLNLFFCKIKILKATPHELLTAELKCDHDESVKFTVGIFSYH